MRLRILPFTALILAACGSTQAPSGSPTQVADAPEWVHKGSHVREGKIDGVGIAGGIKNGLSGSPWGFKYVTVPSVIVGQNYQIAYSRGLQYLSVTFEQTNEEAFMLDDRLIKVAISLLKL